MPVTTFLDKAGLRHFWSRVKAYLGENYLTKTAAEETYLGKEAEAASAVRDSAGNVIADTYLPLSGGTMTGEISGNGRFVTNSVNDSFIGIYGGKTYQSGAFLRLDGEGSALYPGAFNLAAANATQNATLLGHPNGTLQWNDRTVECAVEKGTGYLKLSDGTQICYAKIESSADPTNINFPRAFSSAPIVVCAVSTGGLSSTAFVAKASLVTTTGFTPSVRSGDHYAGLVGLSYIAIGTGA